VAHVLVVEDQLENRNLMAYLLRAFAYEVTTADDGAQGLTAARQARPDLMVIDIQMPVMDGFELLAALKADPELSPIPAVAVTALAMVGDRDRILAAGFDGYVSKPIDAMTFVGELETFLPADDRPSGE
jgi:two-component system, cell cycle response regulator